MLPIYIGSKCNIRPSSGMLFQWLNVSVRLCSSTDSSDSSDSSDSDSDTEKVKQKEPSAKNIQPMIPDNKTDLKSFLNNMIQDRTTLNTAKSTPAISTKENISTTATGSIDLNEFVNNMLKARKLEKTIDVAIQPKKSVPKKVKPIPYEKQLVNAAEDVADKLGGDKTKTTLDLVQKILQRKVEIGKKDKKLMKKTDQYEVKAKKEDQQLKESTDKTKSDIDIMEYIKSKRVAKSKQLSENEKQGSFTDERHSNNKSVIQTLLEDYKKQTEAKSISQQLSENIKTPVQQLQENNMRKPFSRQYLNIWNGTPSQVFKNMGNVSPDTPELKTWAALEQKELKALTTYPPANIFQEMILWTEQGKLWKFPIDNEQEMEEEHNIHFSEHVFTERYLKGWCPTSGPIRHFMELVCVGLSKNPYLTVQEKINHIMWYRDYFKSKEELLQELGAIEEPFPDTVKQITQ